MSIDHKEPEEMHGWKFDMPLEEKAFLNSTEWRSMQYLLERCRRAESMRDSAKDLLRIANNEITRLTDLVNRESWAPLDMVAGGPGSPGYDDEPITKDAYKEFMSKHDNRPIIPDPIFGEQNNVPEAMEE